MEWKSQIADDVKRYIKYGLIGLISFIGAGLALFFLTRPAADVVLARTEINFGEQIKTSDLVEKVGDFLVKEEQRVAPTVIQLTDFSVSMTELDTTVLGDQEICFSFSKDFPNLVKKVRVVDREAPVITLQTENMEFTIEQFESEDLMSYVSIADNATNTESLTVQGKVDGTIVEGSDLEYQITAADESGNKAYAVLKIHIKEPEKEPEIEELGDISEKPDSVEEPANQSPSANQTALPVPSAPSSSVVQPSHKPSNKLYLFSDGYTMANVTGACMADLQTSPYPGACIPLQDASGIYTGMELRFD